MRLDASGQAVLCLRQPLRDLLACEINVGGIGEDRRHLTEPIAGDGTCHLQPRYARQCRLDRKGDLFFYIDGPQRRHEAADLYLAIGNVRHRVDG